MNKVILIAVLVASPRIYAACVLQDGVGTDFGKIGVTTEKTVASLPPSCDTPV